MRGFSRRDFLGFGGSTWVTSVRLLGQKSESPECSDEGPATAEVGGLKVVRGLEMEKLSTTLGTSPRLIWDIFERSDRLEST